MSFNCKAGDTIWLPDSQGGHRWILLTGETKKYTYVVLINYTDADYWHDHTVELSKQDNPKLFSKPSCMNYDDAQFQQSSILFREFHQSRQKFLSCPKAILIRIVIGAFLSDHTMGRIINHLKIFYSKEYKKYYTPPII